MRDQDVVVSNGYPSIGFKNANACDSPNSNDVISGISSSEDEIELSPSDFAYLRQADKRAFLLRRSSRDPNLWKTRYCILTDRLWIVNTHLIQHSGSRGGGGRAGSEGGEYCTWQQ